MTNGDAGKTYTDRDRRSEKIEVEERENREKRERAERKRKKTESGQGKVAEADVGERAGAYQMC